MVFPRGLKRICDVCFYMAFASLLGSMMDFGGNLILTLPIFAIIAFLSAFLAPRGLIKYISLLLMPSVFLIITPTIGSLAIFTPITIYLFWSMPKPDERIWQFDYQPAFRLFLKIYGGLLGVLLAFMLLSGGAYGLAHIERVFSADSILFAIMFLLSSTMFIRMKRHDEAVLKQTRFKVVNAIPFIGMLFGAILASSDRVISSVLFLLHFIWFGIVLQIFNLIARLLMMIPDFAINRVDSSNEAAMILPTEEMELELLVPDFLDLRESIEVADGTWFTIFLIIMGVIALIIIFKILSKKVGSPDVRDDGVEEERFALDDPKDKKHRRRNENQVREIYRTFLELIKEKGVDLKLYSTSGEIETQIASRFNSKKSRELREKYIQVRYRGDSYTKDDLKRVKGLYKEIKQEIDK